MGADLPHVVCCGRDPWRGFQPRGRTGVCQRAARPSPMDPHRSSSRRVISTPYAAPLDGWNKPMLRDQSADHHHTVPMSADRKAAALDEAQRLLQQVLMLFDDHKIGTLPAGNVDFALNQVIAERRALLLNMPADADRSKKDNESSGCARDPIA